MSLDIRLNLTIDWAAMSADDFADMLDRLNALAVELEAVGATVTSTFEHIRSTESFAERMARESIEAAEAQKVTDRPNRTEETQ